METMTSNFQVLLPKFWEIESGKTEEMTFAVPGNLYINEPDYYNYFLIELKNKDGLEYKFGLNNHESNPFSSSGDGTETVTWVVHPTKFKSKDTNKFKIAVGSGAGSIKVISIILHYLHR